MTKILLLLCIGSYFMTNFSLASEDVEEFNVGGKLQLPSTGNYEQIPKGTCIHLSVVDGIQCEYCTPVKRGNLVLKNFKVLKNEIPFNIPCHGGKGVYYVSATLYYGWCSDGNQSLKKGDYHNDFQVEVNVKKDGHDVSVNIPLTYYEKESFAKKPTYGIHGTMYFPKEGIYTKIPKSSCLRIIVKPNIAIMCIKPPCVIPAVATYTMYDRDIKFVGNTLQYKMPTKLKLNFYVVRAILNLGWCSKYDEDYPREQWLSDNDYYSGSQSTFMVESNGDTFHNIDLTMSNTNGKYLCGKRRCYKTETCVKGTYEYECKCQIPAIAIVCNSFDDKPFCGTDGRTYRNRCFSNRADCFSNTIQVAHLGECQRVAKFGGDEKEVDSDNSYRSSQTKTIRLSVGVGLLGALIIILSMVTFCLKSRKRSQRENPNTSVGFEPKSPVKSHVDIPHANINKGCAYITKNEEDVEVKERAVYMEEPPSYVSYTLQDSPPSYESLPPKV